MSRTQLRDAKSVLPAQVQSWSITLRRVGSAVAEIAKLFEVNMGVFAIGW
jgi:aspartate ammonia-lyase